MMKIRAVIIKQINKNLAALEYEMSNQPKNTLIYSMMNLKFRWFDLLESVIDPNGKIQMSLLTDTYNNYPYKSLVGSVNRSLEDYKESVERFGIDSNEAKRNHRKFTNLDKILSEKLKTTKSTSKNVWKPKI